MDKISHRKLKEILKYNPKTGVFTWRTNKYSRKVTVGSVAGCLAKTGYRIIRIFGKQYKEHQLAYFYMNGEWAELIDHLNHNKSDNRICNLRASTRADNMKNLARRRDSNTGEQGIWYNRKKDRYIAYIYHKGKRVWERSFINPDEAILARRTKLNELGFHENHGIKLKEK